MSSAFMEEASLPLLYGSACKRNPKQRRKMKLSHCQAVAAAVLVAGVDEKHLWSPEIAIAAGNSPLPCTVVVDVATGLVTSKSVAVSVNRVLGEPLLLFSYLILSKLRVM